MANQYLKLRRSSVPGKVPDTASLDFGEIALNTYDGLAFMKKDGSNGIEVVSIGSNQGAFTGSFSGSFTGSLFGTSSWAENSLTASYFSGSITSASYAYTASSAISASYASFVPASGVIGLSLFQIATGSVTASVDTNKNSIFLIKSGSVNFLNISSSGDTTLSSDLFIVKSLATQQPVLTVSQSIVKIATHSFDPTGMIDAGSIWFTSAAMYIGLE